jgi:hypothetical protein
VRVNKFIPEKLMQPMNITAQYKPAATALDK